MCYFNSYLPLILFEIMQFGPYFFQVADALWHLASFTALLQAFLSFVHRPASVTFTVILSVMSWLHLLFGRPLPLRPSIMPPYILIFFRRISLQMRLSSALFLCSLTIDHVSEHSEPQVVIGKISDLRYFSFVVSSFLFQRLVIDLSFLVAIPNLLLTFLFPSPFLVMRDPKQSNSFSSSKRSFPIMMFCLILIFWSSLRLRTGFGFRCAA